MYNLKITFVMSFRGNIVKNVNINPLEIVNFRKFAKIYTRENIYIHSSTSALSHQSALLAGINDITSGITYRLIPCTKDSLVGFAFILH